MDKQEETALVPVERVALGVLPASGPADVIHQATNIAKQLASIIRDRKLFSRISGKEFVRVEGWSTLGAMLGVLPREVSVVSHEDGSYEATVELIRTGDGAVIGGASAICGTPDEAMWAKRPAYARRSMATTRATGKAYRLGFSWIMALAGYEPTPAEEMDVLEGEFEERPPRKQKSQKGNGSPPTLHSDFEPIADIEALELGSSFHEAAVSDLGYNHPSHVTNTLVKELGQGWGQRYTKTHLWHTLERHQAQKETA